LLIGLFFAMHGEYVIACHGHIREGLVQLNHYHVWRRLCMGNIKAWDLMKGCCSISFFEKWERKSVARRK